MYADSVAKRGYREKNVSIYGLQNHLLAANKAKLTVVKQLLKNMGEQRSFKDPVPDWWRSHVHNAVHM